MPSQYERLFEAFASPLMDNMVGQAIDYRTRGGNVLENCVGVWAPDDFINPAPDENGRVEKANGTVSIRKSWFAARQYTPQRGDDVTIDGKLFAVLHIVDSDDGWFALTLGSTKRTETSDGATRRGGSR
jgi:hypothetical protein